jgi:hypothetical protein
MNDGERSDSANPEVSKWWCMTEGPSTAKMKFKI